MGRAVGVHTAPVSSSRKKIASDCGSLTGSLCQGVSRLAWLLPHQVKPSPLSLTMVPKCGLAITFTHGAGVLAPAGREIAYSQPSCVNPPSPLKYGKFQ